MNYDEETSNEAQANGQSACTIENSGEAAGSSQEDSISAAIKGNSCPSKDQDQLADSIMSFIAVQELLGKELQMFSKIGREYDPDKRGSLLPTVRFTSPRDTLEKLNRSKASEEEAELESLFQQKIEAEIECLTLTSSIENLKPIYGDQAKSFKEQAAEALKQRKMLKEIGEQENKDGESKKNAEETAKIRRKACKAASCSFIQLVLLLLAVPLFASLLSDSEMIVPT